MIVDVTRTILIPGNEGKDCPANGTDPNVECCCEECDYLWCCLSREEVDDIGLDYIKERQRLAVAGGAHPRCI